MSTDAMNAFDNLIDTDKKQGVEIEFAEYLAGAHQLYQTQYIQALKTFKQLEQAEHPWIAETSSYLVGRIHLINAQTNWNGYSLPGDTINGRDVAAAEAAFSDHLLRYPHSVYRNSIEGLTRRIAYFKGDEVQLNALLDAVINNSAQQLQDDKNRTTTDAFQSHLQEWKKYSNHSVDYATAPFLMIAYDVMHAQDNHQQKLDTLNHQRQKFDEQKPLYALLEAMLLFQLGRYDEIPVSQYNLNTQVGIGLAAYQAKAAFKRGEFQQARSIWTDIRTHSDAHQQWEAPRSEIAASYVAEGAFREMAHHDAHIDSLYIFQDAFLTVCDASDLVDIANDSQAPGNARKAARYEAFSRAIHSNDFTPLHQLSLQNT